MTRCAPQSPKQTLEPPQIQNTAPEPRRQPEARKSPWTHSRLPSMVLSMNNEHVVENSAGGATIGDPIPTPLPPADTTDSWVACMPDTPPDLIGLHNRLRREKRWVGQAETKKNELIKAAKRQGMDKPSAQAAAYHEIDRLYPPLPPPEPPPPPPPPPEPPAPTDAGQVRGLGTIPSEWPTLPANASLQAEIGWVQANRLSIVQDSPSGGTIVHLEHALSPAPSHAALGWLETSIRSYAKYVDVAAKAMSSTITEHEQVQRERHSIEEIRAVLQQMLDE